MIVAFVPVFIVGANAVAVAADATPVTLIEGTGEEFAAVAIAGGARSVSLTILVGATMLAVAFATAVTEISGRRELSDTSNLTSST